MLIMKALRPFLILLLLPVFIVIHSCSEDELIHSDSLSTDELISTKTTNANYYTLTADHIISRKGYWQDAPLSKLNTKDQSGQNDNWSKYIDFQPNSQRYVGDIYYYLPDSVDKSDVVEIKVKTNYKGWGYSKQRWFWKLRNFSSNAWNTIGNNSFANAWVWTSKTWTITSNAYINESTGIIRLRYQSNNAKENSNLDYLVVEIKTTPPPTDGKKLLEPSGNHIYLAAYPNFGGFEDEVTADKIATFESQAGKDITWAYFSDNWFDGINFPTADVNTIHNAGKVPFIRIMPRNEDEDTPDPVYTMQAFIDGDFDNDISQWARDAKAMPFPLLVEFGTECNGEWFPWNAKWNGKNSKTGYGDPNVFDGTERFRDAYRHIIDIFNNEGVDNVTWFFHVNVDNDPQVNWNKMKDYYPGDDYIDWIGISVYGPQDNKDGWWSFEDLMNDNWNEIKSISTDGKPIAVLEMGVVDDASLGDKAQWITDAFYSIGPNGTYDQDIDAISWWDETFRDDNNYNVNLSINSSSASKQAYRDAVSNSIFISTPSFSD